MDFLRKHAQQSAVGFKELADEVWSEVGATEGLRETFKGMEKTAGKYALTAQLLMTLNYPQEAETFRNGFNATGPGPTGSEGFADTPIGTMLDAVSELSQTLQAQAIGTTGAADISQTSTYEDLSKVLPRLRALMGEK